MADLSLAAVLAILTLSAASRRLLVAGLGNHHVLGSFLPLAALSIKLWGINTEV